MNELPTNAISMLELMPSQAKEVSSFSYQIIKAVKNGEADPLKVLVMLKSLEAVYELVRDEISEEILKEAEKYPEKVIERYGARIEKSEVGTNYLYRQSGDQEWERLDAELETLKRRKSEREKFLRSLDKPLTVINPETGEVETISPPIKRSKSGVKVSLK